MRRIALSLIVILAGAGQVEGARIVSWGCWGSSGPVSNIPTDNDFIAIAGGYAHSLALKSNGSIVSWGDDSYIVSNTPTNADYTAIAAGEYHSLALRSDGSLVSWGSISVTPSENNFIAIACGDNYSLALYVPEPSTLILCSLLTFTALALAGRPVTRT